MKPYISYDHLCRMPTIWIDAGVDFENAFLVVKMIWNRIMKLSKNIIGIAGPLLVFTPYFRNALFSPAELYEFSNPKFVTYNMIFTGFALIINFVTGKKAPIFIPIVRH